jgi:hypothetical protein
VTVDLLYQPEALLTAVAAALHTITVGAGTAAAAQVQVDVDAVQGALTPPRFVVERGAGQAWWRPPLDRDQLVHVPFDVTAVGVSLDQAAALRGRAVQALVAMDGAGWVTPLTVPGLTVVWREVAGTLPRPIQAGGLAQAMASFRVALERAS